MSKKENETQSKFVSVMTFFLEYFLFPLCLALIATWLNSSADARDAAGKKADLDTKIISEEFSEFPSNQAKILAMDNLLSQNDSAEHKKVVSIIERSYSAEYFKYLNKGDTQSVFKIRSVLLNIASGKAVDSIQKTVKQRIKNESVPANNGMVSADTIEAKAFNALYSRNYKEAATFFDSADKLHPGIHNSFEIASLLKNTLGVSTTLAAQDSATVFGIIEKRYMWGAPAKYRNKQQGNPRPQRRTY